MKKLITLITVIFFITNTKAQNLAWAKSFVSTTSYGNAVATDNNKNVFTTGYFLVDIDCNPSVASFTFASVGDRDIYISKLDSLGNFIWGKSIGGVNLDQATAIATDSDGNVIIGGDFTGTVDFDPSVGTYTLNNPSTIFGIGFILKLDPAGNFLWANKIETAKNISAIEIDASKNIFFSGKHGNGGIDWDPGVGVVNIITNGAAYVCKYTAAGSFSWAKGMGAGNSDSENTDMKLDNTGNIYTTGLFSGNASFGAGVGSQTLTASGSLDAFVCKLDNVGNHVWAKKIGGINIERGNSIAVDGLGNVYTTGEFDGVVDFDPSAATFTFSTGVGNPDIYISKLDGSGNFVWAKQIGTFGNIDKGFAIAVDAANNIYTTGQVWNATDLDPGPAIYTPTTGGGLVDVFLVKLNAAGNFISGDIYGNSATDRGYGLTIDNGQSVIITGIFGNTVDFDTSPATYTLTASNSNAYVLKLKGTTANVSIKENNLVSTYKLFPNPTSDILNIDMAAEAIEATTIYITNILGEVVLTQVINSNNFSLTTNHLKSGIYFLQIGNSKAIKFIKE
jgi:hypothetical protein